MKSLLSKYCIFLTIGFTFAATCGTRGQCALADFDAQPTVCLEQVLELENLSTGTFDSLIWDFCSGDLDDLISVNSGVSNTSFGRARSVQIIKDNENIYAFAINASTNHLIRLDFENGIYESPVVTNLGSLNNSINSAFGFELIELDGAWYMFVTNAGGKNILRLSFADGIEEIPTVDVLEVPATFSVEGPNSIKIVKDADNFYGFVTAGTSVAGSKLVRLNFGTDLTNNNPVVNEITSSVGTQPRGIDLVKQCENWYGFVVSLTSARLYQLDFGNNLENIPDITELNTGSALRQPTTVKIRTDGNGYFGFIQSARVDAPNAALQRVNFGTDLGNTSITIEKLLFTELIGGAYALDVFDNNSRWIGITFNLSTSQLLTYEFQDDCSFSVVQNTFPIPNVKYNTSGEFEISLGVRDINGSISYSSKTITVTPNTAPSLAISNQTICQSTPIQFNSESDGAGLTYNWDFGDTNTSMDANPSHTYAAPGEYEVTVSIDDGTCGNFTSQTITVFPEPEPDFEIPGGTICTNQEYVFVNSTPGDFGDFISYEWQLDGDSVSVDQDLILRFESGGSKELKLIASIPGCEVEIAKNLTNIREGILPEFTFDDSCVGEDVLFVNNSEGDVLSVNWDFGNGVSSSNDNPTLPYQEAGTYEVTLTVTNTDGCETNDTRPITIFALPQVAFENELACELLETQFIDLSTISSDNLTNWLWRFGDGEESSEQNPAHLFEESGTYETELVATSSFGCKDSVSNVIEVLPSPVAEFTFDKQCLETPIQFQDQSENVNGESITNWSWNLGGVFRTDQNPEITFLDPISYNVSLTVTSENLCTSTVNKEVVIPPQPDLAIQVENLCENEIAQFTDATNIEGDVITAWQWSVGNSAVGDLETVAVDFQNAGDYNVSLEVATENGCDYELSNTITIQPTPTAQFSTSFPFGAPPLVVDFTNESTEAQSYFWDFKDGNTSNEVSPQHIFLQEGNFDVELVAINEFNCFDTAAFRIDVTQPALEIALDNFTIFPTTEGDRYSIVLANNGTIRIDSLQVSVDFGGEVTLAEKIYTNLLPGDVASYQLNSTIDNRRLVYVCLEVASYLTLPETDSTNNSSCITFGEAAFLSTPYPNPTTGVVRFDVVSNSSSSALVSIISSRGQQILEDQVALTPGSNLLSLDLTLLKKGIYFVLLEFEGVRKQYRVVLVD